MQFRFLGNIFFRSTVKLLVEILSEKALQFDVGSFPSVGPKPTVGMLSSPKKKKVFTHNFRPLNGILVPLTAKWSPKKKVFTRNLVISNGNRGPLTAMWLSKNNKKVLNHNSGPPNKIRGSSTAKGISHHTTLGPL